MSNKHFEDLGITQERRYCDIDEDTILEQYGYTTEAIPVVAGAAIAAIVAAVVVVMKLIWDLITKKSDSVEGAITQVNDKAKNMDTEIANIINKFKASTAQKVIESDTKWTERDVLIIDGAVKEADVQSGVKQLDEHYKDLVDIYTKIESDVLGKFYKNVDELEKKLDEKAKLLQSNKSKEEEKTKEAVKMSDASLDLSIEVMKIFNSKANVFKFDHCEEVLKKTTGYKPHTWINVKDPNTTQKTINDNIKAFYDSFKDHMKSLSKDGTVTVKMIEKASIPEPVPASVLKIDALNNLKSKVKLEDDIKKLEDMGKKIDDRIKKMPEGNQKHAVSAVKMDIDAIKSTLAVISTILKVSLDIHLAYCGFYNRIVFCYVYVTGNSNMAVTTDNSATAEAGAKAEVAAEKAKAAPAAKP